MKAFMRGGVRKRAAQRAVTVRKCFFRRANIFTKKHRFGRHGPPLRAISVCPSTMDLNEKLRIAQGLVDEGNTIFRSDDPEKAQKALAKYTKVPPFPCLLLSPPSVPCVTSLPLASRAGLCLRRWSRRKPDNGLHGGHAGSIQQGRAAFRGAVGHDQAIGSPGQCQRRRLLAQKGQPFQCAQVLLQGSGPGRRARKIHVSSGGGTQGAR